MANVVSPLVPVYNGMVFLFVLANFSMATFMDPGVFPRGTDTVFTISQRLNTRHAARLPGRRPESFADIQTDTHSVHAVRHAGI